VVLDAVEEAHGTDECHAGYSCEEVDYKDAACLCAWLAAADQGVHPLAKVLGAFATEVPEV
jgi:hypothetical protein